MAAPTPPHLSPEQRQRLKQLADAARLRAALFPSPKPMPARRRSRQYPAVGRTRGAPRGAAAGDEWPWGPPSRARCTEGSGDHGGADRAVH